MTASRPDESAAAAPLGEASEHKDQVLVYDPKAKKFEWVETNNACGEDLPQVTQEDLQAF